MSLVSKGRIYQYTRLVPLSLQASDTVKHLRMTPTPCKYIALGVFGEQPKARMVSRLKNNR
jgi:hypothetical protein